MNTSHRTYERPAIASQGSVVALTCIVMPLPASDPSHTGSLHATASVGFVL